MNSGKSSCEICHQNTTMSGTQVCPICDPDTKAIIEGRASSKSPNVCDNCFLTHLKGHNTPLVLAICISPKRGEPMHLVKQVEAVAGRGLKGDRYFDGEGSFSQGKIGKRQVTLINAIFFKDSGFQYVDSRRNIVTFGVELMWLINREFKIGTATFRGVKYCDPCPRPNLLKKEKLKSAGIFKDVFSDRAGLVAEVIEDGIIKVNDVIIPPKKEY